MRALHEFHLHPLPRLLPTRTQATHFSPLELTSESTSVPSGFHPSPSKFTSKLTSWRRRTCPFRRSWRLPHARMGVPRRALAVAAVGSALLVPRFVDTRAFAEQAQAWVAAQGPWAPVALVGIHAVALALCFPFAIAFEVLAGALFGVRVGTAVVMAAKTAGASMAFLLARAIFKPKPNAAAGGKDSKTKMKKSASAMMLSSVARGVERDGWKFVFLARLSPLPSYSLNYGLAATNIHFGAFLLATVMGQSLFVWQNVSMGHAVVQASTSDAWTIAKRWSIPILSSILIARKVASYAKEYSEEATHDGRKERDDDPKGNALMQEEEKSPVTPQPDKSGLPEESTSTVRRSARLRKSKQ